MRYSIKWLIEGRVMLVRTGPQLDVEQIINLDADMMTYLDQMEHQFLHVIFDVTETQIRPDLKTASQLHHTRHPRMGWNCVIENFNPLVSFTVTLAAKIHRLRFKKVESLEEAVAFLSQVDPTLDFTIAAANIGR